MNTWSLLCYHLQIWQYTLTIFKNNNETGEVELVGEAPDFQAIDKGITHAVKIRGDYADEPVKDKSGNTYNFLFSADTQADIKAIEEYPGHPMLVVIGENREILIPLIEDWITNLDEESRTLQMTLPEGLTNPEEYED